MGSALVITACALALIAVAGSALVFLDLQRTGFRAVDTLRDESSTRPMTIPPGLLSARVTPSSVERVLSLLGERGSQPSSPPGAASPLTARDVYDFTDLLWATGRREEARRVIEAARDIAGTDASGLHFLAINAKAYSGPDLAAHFYERALVLEPPTPLIQAYYAETLTRIGMRTDEGMSRLRDLHRRYPTHMEVWRVLIRVLAKRGDEEALRQEFSGYLRAAMQDPDDISDCLSLLGEFRTALGYSDETSFRDLLEEIRASLQTLRPRGVGSPRYYAKAYARLANHFFLLRDDSASLRAYAEAVKPWPQDVSVLASLAEHLAAWGEMDLAVEFGRVLLRAAPESSAVRSALNAVAMLVQERSWPLVLEALIVLRPHKPAMLLEQVPWMRDPTLIQHDIIAYVINASGVARMEPRNVVSLKESLRLFELDNEEDESASSHHESWR